jgi:ATP synthase protein I
MSQPDDQSQEALRRLQQRLDALSAKREGGRTESAEGSAQSGAAEGYRLLGEVIGGVVGGLGLGWVVDQFAHTTPFGMVGGLLLGTAAAGYVAVKSADRTARRKPGGTES